MTTSESVATLRHSIDPSTSHPAGTHRSMTSDRSAMLTSMYGLASYLPSVLSGLMCAQCAVLLALLRAPHVLRSAPSQCSPDRRSMKVNDTAAHISMLGNSTRPSQDCHAYSF